MSARNNKRIIFVNPPLGIEKRYGKLGWAGGSEAPLALCYLSSVVKKEGFAVKIIDAQACGFGLEETVNLVMSFNPRYVGITASTMAVKSASELACAIKEHKPDIKTIIGGCHVSALPEYAFNECKYFDIGVVGEGEDTIRELLLALDNNLSVLGIKGIIARDDENIHLSPARPRIKDLDTLPFPAFDLLGDINRRYRLPAQSLMGRHSFSLVTSRGCLGKCSFCDNSVFGSYISMHSAEYIVNMMESLNKDYQIQNIMFEDDNFMFSKKRLIAINEMLQKNKIRIPWTCLARIDSVDEESLRIVKDAGCWQVSYGIESGSQRILDFYKKGIAIDKIKKVIGLTKKVGLKSKGFFIWGNPTEDEYSMKETLNFIKHLKLDDISITFATPYPGSGIWANIDSYGKFDRDKERMSCFNPVFLPHNLSTEYLVNSRKQALREFYFRPMIILAYLKRVKSLAQLKGFILSAYYLFCYVFLGKKYDE